MIRVLSSTWLILICLSVSSATLCWSRETATGLSWGFTRTYWDGSWYRDGYAEAGTGGNLLSARRELQLSEHSRLAVVGSYNWMRHTTTTLLEPVVINPEDDEVISGGSLATRTVHSYFRELELAIHLHQSLRLGNCDCLYVGGGPSVRWGAAGKREEHTRVAEFHTQAAWFGLSALAGFRQTWDEERMETFFEPRLLWSPDGADRYQRTFPPVDLSLAMGILW